ncbi:MAG: hypothetical protein D6737_18465 [Chloroflexi bacterium]|nr:MAG: hypothetical protein D6737_18465 [Chloroflexota bacterium]
MQVWAENMVEVAPRKTNTLLIMLAFVLLTLALLAIHTVKFDGRNYRQDEAWAVDGAIENSVAETVQWMARNIHPPGWRVVVDVWVELVGHYEPATRHLSTLYTALTFALLFRLAVDLFDREVGLLAVFILGTLAAFTFFGHEIRPYSALAAGAVGFQLVFLRWLNRRDFITALLVVLFGIGTIYTHFYGLLVIAAQALLFITLVRWNRALYLRAAGLFALIALSFVAWVIPFLHAVVVRTGSGVAYGLPNNFDSLLLIHRQMQLRPLAIGELLLLAGIIMPVMRIFPQRHEAHETRLRFGGEWRKVYVLLPPVFVLSLAIIGNTVAANITSRNLIVILPSLVMVVALAFKVFPRPVQAVVIVLLLQPALTNFRTFIANGPYQEIAAFMAQTVEADDRIFIEAPLVWQHIPLAYTMRQRLPVKFDNDDLMHIIQPAQRKLVDNMPDPAHNVIWRRDEADVARFLNFVGETERLWHIEVDQWQRGDRLLALLDETYVPVRSADWGIHDAQFPDHIVTEYRRIPDDVHERYRFDALYSLQSWTLRDDVTVQPCQTIALESWWQVDAAPPANVSMTLVLVDANGIGIVNTDGTPADSYTETWQPARLYLDERTLTIPCDLPPGEYPLLTGLYDLETVETLPVTLPDGSPVVGHAYLTTLIVE